MAHEVENMMYVGETPWHGLGVKLDKPPTTAEAIVCAGLDWTVEKRDIIVPGSDTSDWRATVRTSDLRMLGMVKANYVPLQNVDAFRFFDPFLKEGVASIETAGSLRGGKRIWILAKVNSAGMEVVPGDVVEQHILLASSHDGSLAAHCGFTPVRVVCNNTMTAAINDADSKLMRVKHSGKTIQTLDMIGETMKVLSSTFEASIEQYRRLAQMPINSEDFKKYVRAVFPKVETAKGAKEGDARGDRIVNEIIPLFESGKGIDIPGVRGTLWAAYNAVTEFTSWQRGRSQDARLDSLWFGASANTNAKALEVALAMAA